MNVFNTRRYTSRPLYSHVTVRLATPGVFGFVLLLAVAPAFTGTSVSHGNPWVGVASDRVAVPPGAIPLDPQTPIQLTLALQPNHPAQLQALDAALASTGGGSRPFLSEKEFEARFSPSAAAVQTVSAYFAAHGATGEQLTSDRLGLTVTLRASAAESALHTSLVVVGHWQGRPLFTAAESPQLPTAVAPAVAGIGGLSNAGNPRLTSLTRVDAAGSMVRGHSPTTVVQDANSGSWWFIGSDYTQAYGASQLFPSPSRSGGVFPTHEAVATILMSGFNDSRQQNLPPWDPAVVGGYFNDTFPAAWPRPIVSGIPVAIGNVTPPLPGNLSGLNDTSFNEAENSLDLEMAGSLAPGSTVVNFYFGASLFSGNSNTPLSSVADDFAQSLSAALSHNYSPARLDAVTSSFGLPDLNDSLWNVEAMHAASLGVSLVAASGDQGNAPTDLSGRFQGPWPTWPASEAFNAYGTIAVGGVTVNVTGAISSVYTSGNLSDPFDPSITGLSSQVGWYDDRAGPGNFSGSEGGLSSVFPEPSWQFRSAAQTPIVAAAEVQGVSSLARAEPDVAFPANATIAYISANNSTVYFEVLEGTSIASPVFAGLLADWSAVAGHPFGFLDPELYRMASYFAQHPGPGNPFLDVTMGGNYAFNAGPGWDAVTGWGGINGSLFLTAEGNASLRNYTFTGPTPGLPPPGLNGPPAPVVAYVIIGVSLATAVVLIIVFGRTRPTLRVPPAVSGYPLPPPPPGWTAPAAPFPPGYGPTPPPTTFNCPYCGTIRSVEPIRCPGCGAF